MIWIKEKCHFDVSPYPYSACLDRQGRDEEKRWRLYTGLQDVAINTRSVVR